MAKMPPPSKDHSNGITICHANCFLVAYGTTRLNNCSDTRFGGRFNTVCKREEGIRSQYRTTCPLRRFLYRELHTGDTIHLPCTYTYHRKFMSQDNGSGFDMAQDVPGKHEAGHLFSGWSALGTGS